MKTQTKFVCAAFAMLTSLALAPTANAVVPSPDGGYPGANTAEGQNALFSRTTGGYNTALGYFSLRALTTGNYNTATGAYTLYANSADENTATGTAALFANTTGGSNTANGAFALFSNTTGCCSTANGDLALFSNTTGYNNTAYGFEALYGNTTGFRNTAVGSGALVSNTIGSSGTAIGRRALVNNTTGNNNIALGGNAGENLTTGDNNIDIGNSGISDEANTIRIGDPAVQTATFIAGINGATASGGVAVYVNSAGQLGTLTSSARFKDEIKPMDKASEAVLGLKPVTFRYKHEIDPKGIPQFGLVAEDVEKVNPDLVARDADGEAYTVRYEAVNAMLLNEFLKEHRKVEEQDERIEKQELIIARQQKQIEALTTGLRKVSDKLELSKPAPQVVENRQ